MSVSKSWTKDGRKTDDIKWNTSYLTEGKEQKRNRSTEKWIIKRKKWSKKEKNPVEEDQWNDIKKDTKDIAEDKMQHVIKSETK